MTVIIIPAAGKSSRFSRVKPKPFLTNPNGNLMMKDCLTGIDISQYDKVYITFLREHFEKYCHSDESFIRKNMDLGLKLEICILDEPTRSQCETVTKTIQQMKIDSSILIKDVDNCFRIKQPHLNVSNNNGVCCMKLNPTIKHQQGKSYIKTKSFWIKDIVEKKVISDTFCVGGYFFFCANQYVNAYNKLKNSFKREIYTSDLIKYMMKDQYFLPIEVDSYCDWGTMEDWMDYKNLFKTIFCDIDGTLFKNCGEYTPTGWGHAGPLAENVKRIKELTSTGKVQLILTTARKEKYRDITEKQLAKYGIEYQQLIMGLHHCRRYIINDYSDTNIFPSCVAINLKRDDDKLSKHI